MMMVLVVVVVISNRSKAPEGEERLRWACLLRVFGHVRAQNGADERGAELRHHLRVQESVACRPFERAAEKDGAVSGEKESKSGAHGAEDHARGQGGGHALLPHEVEGDGQVHGLERRLVVVARRQRSLAQPQRRGATEEGRREARMGHWGKA